MPVNNSGTGSINWIIMIIYLKVNYYTCIGVIGICFADLFLVLLGFFLVQIFVLLVICFVGMVFLFCSSSFWLYQIDQNTQNLEHP